jgi:D-3-phosphoglycerate dehydrogenase
MSPETWEVLLPPTIDPVGPESISDIATFTRRDEYENRDALLGDINRFDAIITRTEEVPAELIDAAESLKIIAKHGTGVDNIDIETATRRSIIVANTPDANTTSVAEHAVMLLLAVKRNVVRADTAARDGDWRRHDFCGRELSGRTLGLFGAGNVGRRLTQLLTGFGVSFVAYDPYVASDALPSNISLVESVEALFDVADDISVHTPLTEETRHAIGREAFVALSDDGVVVNTARGGIIDEDALAAAISENNIAGAGIDVYENEPPTDDNPLFDLEQVVLTQHTAGVTVEALRNMSHESASNVRTVYEGGIPKTALNADELAQDTR